MDVINITLIIQAGAALVATTSAARLHGYRHRPWMWIVSFALIVAADVASVVVYDTLMF